MSFFSRSFSPFVGVVAAVAALAGLLFGFDTGVISGALLFIKKDFPEVALQPLLQGLITSAITLGAVIGAGLGGTLSDYLGRRRVLMVTALIFAIGSLGTALAPTPWILVTGRIFLGLAIGIASFVAPMYIGEIAPPSMRGRLVSLNQLMITIGIMVSYGSNYFFSEMAEAQHLSESHAWGWMLGVGALPALVLGIGMFFLPESPRWLAAHQGKQAARHVLEKIRPSSQTIEKELHDISESLCFQGGHWKDLQQPWLRPLLIVGIGLGIFQQITGINTIIYYAPTILEMAGFEKASSAIFATAWVGAVNVGMTVVAISFIDRWGRRPLLLLGMIGMALGTGTLAWSFASNALTTHPWIAVGCLMLYVASFAISLGPIFWLIIAEIYPTSVRGVAMGLATMIQWIANLIVALTFPSLLHAIGPSLTFGIFTFLTLLAWLFAYRLVPETKGISLESIEDYCRQGKPLRHLKAS